MNSFFVPRAKASAVDGLLRGLTYSDMIECVHKREYEKKGRQLNENEYQEVLGRAWKLTDEREAQGHRFIILEEPNEDGDFTVVDTDTGEVLRDVVRHPKPREWELGHYESYDKPWPERLNNTTKKETFREESLF